MAKTNVWIIVGVVFLVALVGLASYSLFGGKTSNNALTGNVIAPVGGAGGQPTVPVPVGCSQVPAYSYAGVNALTGAVIGGTNEIKLNDNAPVTTLASPTAGLPLKYWVSNSTFMCNVKDAGTVQCGAQNVQADCYQNASITLSLFDILGNQYLTSGGGALNVTIGANTVTNIRLDYQGTAYQSRVPLGGCVAVEVPSSFTSVTIAGLGACPYKWTYTTSSTGNTYYMFGIPTGWDVGDGALKSLPIQLRAGASNPSGTGIITVIPANNYIGNDKNFHLGIEKDFNNDNTKTFDTGSSFTFGIN